MSNVNESINLDKHWELVNFCEFDKYATKSYCAIHNVDESLNLGDITRVDETKLKPFNMICGGSPCFVKGTKVYTSTGYRNIEDVKIGDLVLTHTGNFKKVVRVGNKFSDEVYELKAQGVLNTTVTGNHPYYVRSSKRKWNNDRRSYDRIFTNPEWKSVKDIADNEYIGLPILNTSENIYNLSNDECWLLGRYVADGYICNSKRLNRNNSYNHKVTFCIGKDKLTEFKKATFNSRYHIGVTEDRTAYKCRIIDINFMNLCLQCGKGAENKNIPHWILNLPIEMLRTFLDGYMSGDGCYTNSNYKATTISKKLAMGLCLCIAKVYGVGARIYKTKRKKKTVIEGRIVNQKDSYEVVFTKEKRKQTNYVAIDNIIWLPVRAIKKLDYPAQVYNLEVENDNSYTANNAIVHNCQDFSVAGKQKGSVWTCEDCGHEYNPLTVHWSERDKCPQCNSSNIEKTRSSLLVEYLRVIRANKPNFGIYENVKNIVGKQFRDTTFKLFEDELHEYGYNTYWKVLNAKNYGIPQNRERVYLIFIRKDLDNGQFKFPEPFDNGIRLKDVLEDEVDEKFYLSDDKVQKFLSNFNESDLPVTTRNSDISATVRASYYKNGSRNICENIENGNGYEGVVESNNPKFLGNVNNPEFGTGYAGGVWDSENISPTLTTMQDGGRQPHIVCSIDKSNNNPEIIDNANCITSREDRGISNRKGEGTAVLECPETSYCIDANYYKGTSPEEYVKKHRRQLVFEERTIKIPQATKHGYIECEVGGVADLSYPNSKTRRGRVQENGTISPTITATETGICRIEKADGCYTNQSSSFTRAPLEGVSRTLKADSHPAGVYDGIRIRKLTPKECFRLMGFSDKDFDAAKNVGVSNSQLYKQAGNSIVVDVLYYIYVELYKAMPYLFDDLKLSSFFSGIGAFEAALDKLYEGINSGNFTNPQVE